MGQSGHSPQSLLLHRLASGAAGQANSVASVLAHLRVLLNTRQGTSLSCPDYGLLDLLPLLKALPHSRQALCERLRLAIEAHEPRLTRVRVQQLDASDAFALHYAINARLTHSGAPIALTTRVLASQQLEVS